jgi:CRISPR system Cascade subunit CasB
MSITFAQDSPLGLALLDWWRGLDADRGSRAVLRRADSVTAIMLSPAFQRLRQRLLHAGWPGGTQPGWRDERLAAIAGLLAHVTENDDRPLPLAMSKAPGDKPGDKPPVSELRFLRLLESPDLDALFSGLRRVLPLMRDRADVLALAQDVLFFHSGDSVRKRWAYSYQWPEKSAA